MSNSTCKLNAVMCDHILKHTHTLTLTLNRLSHKRNAKAKAVAQKDFQFVKILSSGGQAIGNGIGLYLVLMSLWQH